MSPAGAAVADRDVFSRRAMTRPGTHRETSPESMGETASSAVDSPSDAKPASPRTPGNHAEQNRLKPCRGKPFDLCKELKFESLKRKFPLNSSVSVAQCKSRTHSGPAALDKRI